ncbi:hypothetical protein GALMADRAFT_242496 [Galerina marginata CBS 339.88]|uniref:Uncharacterized protein n=1 Tax=Galerina marginata (strain CBS 339.88) TaxID=685588 RepID=A0A067TAF6_GALM3|nr:hypothetical protein GALMADRAFT_242496 [Galerina marginata CBS 339.88]
MYMTSMVYECWDGGQLYHNPLKVIRQDSEQSEDPNSPLPPPKPIKPLWTRVAFGAFHCGLGGFIAAFLLSQRSSWIRSMTIVGSRRKASSQLYIETAGHPHGYGHPFRMQDCSLANYSNNSNIMMVDTGKEGKFPFYPTGALIGLRRMPSTGDIGKINMLKVWKEFGGTIQQKSS